MLHLSTGFERADRSLPYHRLDGLSVPLGDVAAELAAVLECAVHVGDERHVPIRNRSVMGVLAGDVEACPVHR